MSRKNTFKSDLVLKYINKFPGISKAALARKITADHPLHFTVENARMMIRDKTGNAGGDSRKNKLVDMPVVELPASKISERKFVKVEKKNILWLSDIHIPYQDNRAIELAVKYGIANKIDCVILGGDVMDNKAFSPHDGEPPTPDDVREQFEATEQFLKYLRAKFKNVQIIWIEGNHDFWIKRWLMKHAPILFNDPYYHLPQRLNLKNYNIDFYTQEHVLQLGKLNASHGHTVVKGVFAPVNAARGVFVKTKSNYIIGHCHATSQHIESNIKGEQIGCFSTGCLCELSPSYDPHNTKHNLGFAHIAIDSRGGFIVHNKMIVNYEVR